MTELLPRARFRDVVRGRAPVVGARCDPEKVRGLVSPVEARVAMGLSYGDLQTEEARCLHERRSTRSDATVVGRAIVAAALSCGKVEGVADARPAIVSTRVDNLTVDEALAEVLGPPDAQQARMIHFAHAHALNLAVFDADLADELARADRVFPDGIGVRTAARILGIQLQHNINGTDLLPLLCSEAAQLDIPLVLVGAAPGVAEACAGRLVDAHPGLRIGRVADGYLDAQETRALVAELETLGRCIVLVGMGSPRQEHFAWQHLRSLPQATVMTVGGLFDFFSGRVARAPVAWRELGLEWAWRLAQEPRRLARRYLLGNPWFLSLACVQRATGRPLRTMRR